MLFLKYLFTFSLLLGTFNVSASLLMRTSFENVPEGTPFTRDLWTDEGFQPASWDEGLASRTRTSAEHAAAGLQSLRVMYPKNEFGTAHTGCQVPLLFESRNEAYMSYFLMFSDNFSWGTSSYGGKLPGLSGGDNCSGGAMCDGTNGWSARFMWRAGGKIMLYLYDMVKTDTYGENHQLYFPDGSPVVAVPGKWMHIAERVKANSTPDSKDGEVQVWVNGQEVLFLKGRQFTNNGEQVDKLYISTFHGGDDETWCPTDTCFTFFDDLCIGTEYDDVRFPDCRKPDLGSDCTLCNASGSVSLSAANLSDNYHLSWFRNGEMVGGGATLVADVPGCYMVVADSGRCSLTDTVYVSNSLEPHLGTGRHLCETSFLLLDCGLKADDGLSFSWQRDGARLVGEDVPALLTKEAGKYTVTVSSDKCASGVDSVVVTSGLLQVPDADVTVGVPVVLQVEQPGNYVWTDLAGNTLATGSSFTFTPSAGDDYLFISDADGFDGFVGKRRLTENAWTRSNFSTEYMYFTVKRDVVIDSISIYPVKPLDATISIVDEATHEVVFSQTYSNLAGGCEQRLPLGVSLGAGSYHIDADGTTAPLYHSHTDADIQFPYTVDGLIELTGCNLDWINNKGWYLFFYNWHVSAGNHCAPTPIRLRHAKTGVGNVAAGPNTVWAAPSDGLLVVGGLEGASLLTLYDAQGRKVASKKTSASSAAFYTSYFPKGVYMLVVQSGADTVYRQKVIVW